MGGNGLSTIQSVDLIATHITAARAQWVATEKEVSNRLAEALQGAISALGANDPVVSHLAVQRAQAALAFHRFARS